MTGGASPPQSEWTGAADGVPGPGSSMVSSLPLARSPRFPPPEPGLEQARLALRLVVHLAHVGPPPPDDTVSPESTQQGMASRLGATQGAISKVLRRLVAADVVRHARHHVRGQNRRMRAYFLTPRGFDIARRCRDRFPDAELHF
jgi:hypothetical protein